MILLSACQTYRNNLLRSSGRLREIISSPDFVKYFGEAKARADGQRQNIFGNDDELKVAPKGVVKTHKSVPSHSHLWSSRGDS